MFWSFPLTFATSGLEKWPWLKIALTSKGWSFSLAKPTTFQEADLALFNFRVFILRESSDSGRQDWQFTRTNCCLVVWYYPDSTRLKWGLSGVSGSWYLCWQEAHGTPWLQYLLMHIKDSSSLTQPPRNMTDKGVSLHSTTSMNRSH